MRKPNIKSPLGDGLRHWLAISIIRPAIVSVIVLFLLCPAQSAFAGLVIGWGWNDYGQSVSASINNYTAISAGWNHSLALKSDGTIVGWGYNATPPAGNDFIAIAGGGEHSIALRSDGSIVGWGANYYGQATPPAGNNFIAISAGAAMSTDPL